MTNDQTDHFYVDEDGYGEPCVWYGKGPDDLPGYDKLVLRKHNLDRESVELWPKVSAALVGKPLDLEMTSDYRAHQVEPGTPYLDEPTVDVPPGWYVVGDRGDEEYGRRLVIKIEEATDDDGEDVRADFSKDLAVLLNRHFSGGDD